MDTTTQQRVERILNEVGYNEECEITFDSNLASDLGFDSLDRLDLAMKLEREFEITIPDEHFDKVQTVGDVMRLVASFEKK